MGRLVDKLNQQGGRLTEKLAQQKVGQPLYSEEELKTPGLFGKITGFMGMEKLGRRAASEIAKLDPQHRANLEAISKTNPELAKQLETGGVSTKQAIGSAIQTGVTTALPFARPAGLFTTAGIQGGMGATAGLGGALQEDRGILDTAKSVALGGALGAIVPSVISKAPGILKGAGEKLYRVGVPTKEATAKALQTYQAGLPTLGQRIGNFLIQNKKPSLVIKPITEAETAARKGFVGTEWQLGVQAKRAEQEIWSKIIQPALKSTKEKVNMPQFFNEVRKKLISENPDLSRRKVLLKAFEAAQSDFKKVSNISLEKLQSYKEGWAKFIPERAYKGEPIAGALNDVRIHLAQKAREKIYNILGSKVKQAYIDYGNLTSIQEAGIKTMDQLRSRSAFRQIWEMVADKILTPVSTVAGKTLYRSGEGLEFIGNAEIKNIRDLISR